MQHTYAIHIATFFLAWQLLIAARLTCQRYGWSAGSFPVNPLFFLLIAATVFFLTVVGVWAWGAEFVGLALVLAITPVIVLADSTAALVMLIAYFVVRPWEYLDGAVSLAFLPRTLAVLALIGWLTQMWSSQRVRFYWHIVLSISVSFCFWMIITVLIKFDLEQASGFFSGSMPVLVILFLILNVPEDAAGLAAIRQSVYRGVAAIIAIAIWHTFIDSAYLAPDNRLYGLGLMGNSNDLAALIVLGMPLLMIPWLRKQDSNQHWLGKILILSIYLSGLWYSQSRGALFALVAGIAVYTVLNVRSVAKLSLLAIFGTVVFLAMTFGIQRDAGDLDTSSESRRDYMEAALRMMRDNPVFGVGVNNYPKFYERYARVFHEEGAHTAHNSWLLPAAEGGLPGALLYLSLFIVVLRYAWRLRDKLPEYFYALIIYGVAMCFLSHTYLVFPFMLYGFVAVSNRLLAKEEIEELEGLTGSEVVT